MINRKGLSLIELMLASVMVGIITIALTCQYVAEQTFRSVINNQVIATSDASLAMRHMARILRYAIPSTINTTTESGYVTSIKATISHDAAGASLPEFTSDTNVVYGRKDDNTFEYKMGGNTPYVISTNITEFPVINSWWDDTSGNLILEIAAQRGDKRSALKTTIHVLGG